MGPSNNEKKKIAEAAGKAPKKTKAAENAGKSATAKKAEQKAAKAAKNPNTVTKGMTKGFG